VTLRRQQTDKANAAISLPRTVVRQFLLTDFESDDREHYHQQGKRHRSRFEVEHLKAPRAAHVAYSALTCSMSSSRARAKGRLVEMGNRKKWKKWGKKCFVIG
jgi:hypothetical protein